MICTSSWFMTNLINFTFDDNYHQVKEIILIFFVKHGKFLFIYFCYLHCSPLLTILLIAAVQLMTQPAAYGAGRGGVCVEFYT